MKSMLFIKIQPILKYINTKMEVILTPPLQRESLLKASLT